jgi:hypothetical protein
MRQRRRKNVVGPYIAIAVLIGLIVAVVVSLRRAL